MINYLKNGRITEESLEKLRLILEGDTITLTKDDKGLDHSLNLLESYGVLIRPSRLGFKLNGIENKKHLAKLIKLKNVERFKKYMTIQDFLSNSISLKYLFPILSSIFIIASAYYLGFN